MADYEQMNKDRSKAEREAIEKALGEVLGGSVGVTVSTSGMLSMRADVLLMALAHLNLPAAVAHYTPNTERTK